MAHLLTLRGQLLASDVSPAQILAVCSGDRDAALLDASCASRRIGYFDCLDMVCRVALSRLWRRIEESGGIDTTDHVMAAYNAELPEGANEPSEEFKDTTIRPESPPAIERLAERLTAWTSLRDL